MAASPLQNGHNGSHHLYNAEPFDDNQQDEKKSTEENEELDVFEKDGYVHLLKEESPLSTQEIYNIEYSSKFQESMDFKNIQTTFNKYHQINLSYEQIQDKNPQYKSASMHFFKDLDATLCTIGCLDDDRKRFFIQCRQHILFKMLDQINLVKAQYEYLTSMILLTPPLMLRLQDLHMTDYWSVLSDASFIAKLQYSYDVWTKNSKKSETEFKNEVSGALHINPIYIKVNGVGRGLNDLVIEFTVSYIWIPFYIQGVETDVLRREYAMKSQDQIEVLCKKQWVPSTILQVSDAPSLKGKKIKVRYNKLNAKDRFKTKNTESLWTVKEYHRLRLPDNVYVIISYNGVKIGTIFKPPLLAFCRGGDKQLIDVGHHIFVKRNAVWYRCEVINSVLDGKKIEVLYLVNTFVKNTEWLRLYEPVDLDRISLEDMR